MEPNAELLSREDLTSELAVFRIKPIDWELPEFMPGQYGELALPHIVSVQAPGEKVIRRSYSIASRGNSKDELEFYIVCVQGGALTPHLWKLTPGDKLWLGPKIKGKFTLEEVPPGSDVVMVATGTGLAPFLSMLRTHAENPPWHRLVIVHGARIAADLGYREELENAQKKYPWFRYLPALTRHDPASGIVWDGLQGRVQTLFSNGHVSEALGCPISKDRTHVMLCGNPQMIDDIEGLLAAEHGLLPHKKKTPGNIHVERYW